MYEAKSAQEPAARVRACNSKLVGITRSYSSHLFFCPLDEAYYSYTGMKVCAELSLYVLLARYLLCYV